MTTNKVDTAVVLVWVGNLLAWGLVLLLFLALTGCGFDDETLEAEHYTQMVCAEAWPDYKHQQPDCEKRRGPNVGYNP